jgi:hypothetical protein
MLLEVYSLEKVKSLKVFETSFKVKTKKVCMDYGDYQRFMAKSFIFLNSGEIAEIYR